MPKIVARLMAVMEATLTHVLVQVFWSEPLRPLGLRGSSPSEKVNRVEARRG